MTEQTKAAGHNEKSPVQDTPSRTAGEDGVEIPISKSTKPSSKPETDAPAALSGADSEEESQTKERPEEQSEDQSLEAQLTAAEARAQDHYDRLLRISAEFDNYKKRTSREMSEIRKYASEGLCRDLLTVVDNLERAMEAAEANGNANGSMLEGIGMTHKELLKVLDKYHVRPLAAVGEIFDPNLHQAVLQEPAEDKPANTVLREFNKGYMIRERLLRPAMVVVAKGGPQSAPQENSTDNQKVS